MQEETECGRTRKIRLILYNEAEPSQIMIQNRTGANVAELQRSVGMLKKSTQRNLVRECVDVKEAQQT